jgi:hypothetical protein
MQEHLEQDILLADEDIQVSCNVLPFACGDRHRVFRPPQAIQRLLKFGSAASSLPVTTNNNWLERHLVCGVA